MDDNKSGRTVQQWNDLLKQASASGLLTVQQHQQMETVQRMVDHLYPLGTTSEMTPLKQPPNQELLGELSQFGNWLEDTFLDAGLLKDGAQAIGIISTALSSGAPINSAINSAGNSILPFFIQLAGKILGLG